MYWETYKIAGHSILVNSIYMEIHRMCKDYKTFEPHKYSVTICQEDILREREKSEAEDKKQEVSIRRFSEEYLETLAVYRKISELLLDKDILLFHGSAIAVDGHGYLFTAKSGTGKSTHTRLWRRLLGERAIIINDDKPLLHVTNSEVTVYGTPWDGKHHLSNNIKIPLKSICVLKRDSVNHIAKISKFEAYPSLFQQVYRPADMLKMKKTLDLFDLLTAKVELYELGCNMDLDSARISYEGMK